MSYGSHLAQASEKRSVSGILHIPVSESFKPWEISVDVLFSIVGFVTFFILVCHHTPYAQPWIYPAIAFYGLDMLLRFLRFRFKSATLSATDSQISLVCLPLSALVATCSLVYRLQSTTVTLAGLPVSTFACAFYLAHMSLNRTLSQYATPLLPSPTSPLHADRSFSVRVL